MDTPPRPSRQPGLEIERVFLLRGLPPLPPHTQALRIEQGYLHTGETGEAEAAAPANEFREGRIRRIIHPDGRIELVHTIKSGSGRVRTEIERPMTREQFEQAWPATAGRRIRKTRYRVPEGELVWEVDQFDDLDLVLAEVELSRADEAVTHPPWLAPYVVREVTDEPEYRNYALAMKVVGMRG